MRPNVEFLCSKWTLLGHIYIVLSVCMECFNSDWLKSNASEKNYHIRVFTPLTQMWDETRDYIQCCM